MINLSLPYKKKNNVYLKEFLTVQIILKVRYLKKTLFDVITSIISMII